MISIIVPVYNVAPYLQKCIESILAQTNNGFELVLVNDGSTDNSGKICDEYATRFSNKIHLINQQNLGLGAARNRGIEASKGDYLLFVDSDDYIEPNTIELLYEKIRHTKADLIVFDYQSVDIQGNILSKKKQRLPVDNVFSLKDFPQILLTDPLACNKLFHRDLFVKNNIYFPSKVWYEDIRTTTKIYTYVQKCVYLDKVFYNYLQREGSIMNNLSCERNREIIFAFQDIIYYFKKKGLFETYKKELEFLTIQHVYLFASVRVILIDRKNTLLREFHSFLEGTFPEYKTNKYLGELSRNHKLVYILLKYRMYKSIALLFAFKRWIKSYRR